MDDPRITEALHHALELGEVGVQVAAFLNDELIIESWIGKANEETGELVKPTTLFPMFSVTKAITATALHLQVERGCLDLDEPIARYWPEYGINGKDKITARHILTHRGGVPQMPADLTLERIRDWEWIVERLEKVVPLCPPNSRSMYHVRSFGFILGELVRRTDPNHRPFGLFLQEELCEPLGIGDLWIGLPEEEEYRVARLTYGASPPQQPQIAPNPIRDMSLPATIPAVPAIWNRHEIHRACIPSSSGIMTARAAARLFGLLANGGAANGRQLLSQESIRQFTQPRENPLEIDEALGMSTWIGVGGYWLGGEHPPADPVVGTSASILAFGGAGGSIAWADLDLGLSVAIAHNRMFGTLPYDEHPFVPLAEAIRSVAKDRSL